MIIFYYIIFYILTFLSILNEHLSKNKAAIRRISSVENNVW